jgi:hypothetical protein
VFNCGAVTVLGVGVSPHNPSRFEHRREKPITTLPAGNRAQVGTTEQAIHIVNRELA